MINGSVELQTMLKTRGGFRAETYGEPYGGNREMSQVVQFEMNEIWNEDIVTYCLDHYGVYGETTEIFVNHLTEYFKKHFGCKTVYALWLTTKKGVNKHYMMNFGEKPVQYVIPDNAMPISDLGDEGALFVTDIEPRLWKKK